MALTLEVMRALVRKGLGNLTSADIPDADVDLYLNLSLWNLSERFPFKEKECVVETTATIGEAEYAVPHVNALDAIHSITMRNDDGYSWKLDHKSMDFMEHHRLTAEGEGAGEDTPIDVNVEGNKLDKPLFYTRWRNTIYLAPRPDEAYIIRVAYWRTVPSLVAGTVETPDLPRNWHEIVVEGAITRGHYYNEDYNLAQQAENFRLSHENSAVMVRDKEKRDNRYARVRVLHEFPEDHDDELR